MSIGSGTVLRGKYRLEGVIGKGGMGEVFAAKQMPSETDVAIKIVNRAMAGDILLQRLYREADAARRINSEFIPRLLEVDHTDEGELYLVMERLYGETLSERLKKKRALPWQDVFELTTDLLRGLIDAHTAGIVHRDMKPGNVFLEERGAGFERARILDFGVCKIDSHDAENLTTTGEALGTIAYMAPEQIRGANKVDERADLYSLGMVIFEMLTGRLAYDATGQVALIASKLEHKAKNVRDHTLVAIPNGLDALLTKVLSRKPQDRFGSAQEMLKAWRALGTPAVAPRPQFATSSGQLPSSTDTVMTAGHIAPSGATSLKMWSVAVAVFICVAGGGMLAAYKYTSAPASTAQSAHADLQAPPVMPIVIGQPVVQIPSAAVNAGGDTPAAPVTPATAAATGDVATPSTNATVTVTDFVPGLTPTATPTTPRASPPPRRAPPPPPPKQVSNSGGAPSAAPPKTPVKPGQMTDKVNF